MQASLRTLADLLSERNVLDGRIAELIGRPASPGHIGEYIAAAIFRIDLFPSATQKAADGIFREGPLQGKNVNVKLYGKQEGILDIRPDALPDFYLVLSGPRSQPTSSRGSIRPLTIHHVYLFDSAQLASFLKARGSNLGAASSVPQAQWETAEVWPSAANSRIHLDKDQIEALELFTSRTGA